MIVDSLYTGQNSVWTSWRLSCYFSETKKLTEVYFLQIHKLAAHNFLFNLIFK